MPSSSRILIIEDAIEIQVLLKRLLEVEGYTVETASNGQEGLQRLATDQPLPDLILLDLMMPVMDGMMFREKQMSDPRIAKVPVIIMTADGNIDQKKNRVGQIECLKKPLDVDDLLSAIAKHV
jgi:CheY-like chemotaxis protein